MPAIAKLLTPVQRLMQRAQALDAKIAHAEIAHPAAPKHLLTDKHSYPTSSPATCRCALTTLVCHRHVSGVFEHHEHQQHAK